MGFKDIGASVPQLREVCDRAHADGLEVMLEVVSTTREAELRSVAAAVEIGVDWLLGGTHPEDGLKILNAGAAGGGAAGGRAGGGAAGGRAGGGAAGGQAGGGAAGGQAGNEPRPKYCPFPGTVVGHPSILRGDIAEIAEIGRRMTALDGVFGLDLLAYRHERADAAELTRAVVMAASGPVIAAGSVASTAQIAALDNAGAWGFTIGGAIFEGRLPGGPSVAGQVAEVLRAAAGRGPQAQS